MEGGLASITVRLWKSNMCRVTGTVTLIQRKMSGNENLDREYTHVCGPTMGGAPEQSNIVASGIG